MHDLPTSHPFVVRDDGRYFQLVDARDQTLVRVSPRKEELELEACARNQNFTRDQQLAARKEIDDLKARVDRAEQDIRRLKLSCNILF